MSVPIVKEVLGIINGGIKYLTLLQSTSHVRKLRKAIDWAERYIEENDGEKDSAKLSRCKKKFFKYNNG